MTKDLIQVGLWGCGNMGKSLARALVATGEAQLAVAYDALSERTEAIASEFGTARAESAEALLSYPRLDGVIVALPPHLHASATIQAAQAGIHVFVEKPMAVSSAECRQMIIAAQEHHIQLMVGQVLRYYEPYRTILRLHAQGRFGKIFAASISRTVDGRKYAPAGHWHSERAKSGGYIFETGVHELDMLRCLFGRPQTVYALLQKVLPRPHELEDYINVQIRFAQEGVADYEGGTGTYAPRYSFCLYFEEATLLSDSAFDPQALQVYHAKSQISASLEGAFSSEHPVEAELRDWLAALRGEAMVPISGEEGLATVALAETALRSAETGQVMAFTL